MADITIQLEKLDRSRSLQLPVLPEVLQFSGSGGNVSIETIRLGEVSVLGTRKLRTFDLECFFPENENAPYCQTRGAAFKTPTECVAELSEMQDAKEPLRFIVTGIGLNCFYVSIEGFSWEYGPGQADINYKLQLKEYRPYGNSRKTIEQVPDLFNVGARQTKYYETDGSQREKTGFAIGDKVLVSGLYFSSPKGAKALLTVSSDFLTRPYSALQEQAYKAIFQSGAILKEQKAVIIDKADREIPMLRNFDDVAANQDIISLPLYNYCVADADTRRRIGWVAEDCLKHI